MNLKGNKKIKFFIYYLLNFNKIKIIALKQELLFKFFYPPKQFFFNSIYNLSAIFTLKYINT